MFSGLFEGGVNHRKRLRAYKRERFSDYIMPSAFDKENKIYELRDGRLGYGYECYPKPGAGKTR